MFLCVTLSDSPSLTMASGLEGVDHFPFSPLFVPPSLGSRQLQWRMD